MTAHIEPVQDKYKHMIFRSVHFKTIQYISEILLKGELKTITLTLTQIRKKKHVYPIIQVIEWGTHLSR